MIPCFFCPIFLFFVVLGGVYIKLWRWLKMARLYSLSSSASPLVEQLKQSLGEFRTCCPQISCSRILIILSWKHLRNTRYKEGCLTSHFYLKAGQQIPCEEKCPASVPGKEHLSEPRDWKMELKQNGTNKHMKQIFYFPFVFLICFPANFPQFKPLA